MLDNAHPPEGGVTALVLSHNRRFLLTGGQVKSIIQVADDDFFLMQRLITLKVLVCVWCIRWARFDSGSFGLENSSLT